MSIEMTCDRCGEPRSLHETQNGEGQRLRYWSACSCLTPELERREAAYRERTAANHELLVEVASHQDGYRAILVGPVPQRQAIIESAADVAAVARLLAVPVRSSCAEVCSYCRLAGVELTGDPTAYDRTLSARLAAATDAYRAVHAARLDQLVRAAGAVVAQAEPGQWTRAVDADLIKELRQALAGLAEWRTPAAMVVTSRISEVD